MRTVEQILERIKDVDRGFTDLTGAERTRLVCYLPYSTAGPYLNDGTTEKDWDVSPLDEDYIRSQVVEYLPFAFDKAEGHRGISTVRSLSHLRALFWLLGDDGVVAAIDSPEMYPQYGVPVLMLAAGRVDYDVSSLSEAVKNMGQGLICTQGCEEGCGR
jgi:hypothetical protein